MQPIVYIVILVVGFTLNFAWDRTVRRRRAHALTRSRREARPRALPPALDDDERARRLPETKLRAFVELSRRSFIELDALIDHFDLLLLRARDRARFGVVTIRADEPRTAALDLLARWLEAWVHVDEDTRERLASYALGPAPVAEVHARVHGLAQFEFRRDTAAGLEATITDLDRAVIHMQGIVALLEASDDDPYR